MVVFHCEDIHEAVEGWAHVYRELDIDSLVADSLLDGVLDHLPVSLLGVKLVDGEDHRKIVIGGKTKITVGTDLDALRSVDDHNAGVADAESGISSANEVVGTRSVDEVDLLIHKLCIKRSCINRTLVSLLELSIVRHSVLVLNCATSVNYFALEEHCFSQRGLAGFCSSEKYHVADVFG